MGRIGKLLSQRYQARMPRMAARVTQRPVDANGRGLGYVICEVAGVSGVHVQVNPDTIYYPGDSVLVEQRGTPALATYTVLGWQGGPRPQSGMLEITTATCIGGTTYEPGDLLWGNPYAAHFHMDYSTGQINLKTADTLTGRIDAGLGMFMAGNPSGLHGEFTASGISFMNSGSLLSAWDATGRTIYGVEVLGRPHGPGIQQREYTDVDTGETRYAWQVLGLNGVPGISFITGDETDPDDYKFYVGPIGASNRLVYENGDLELTGGVNAVSGTLYTLAISGMLSMEADGVLSWDSNGARLSNDGINFDAAEKASRSIVWTDTDSNTVGMVAWPHAILGNYFRIENTALSATDSQTEIITNGTQTAVVALTANSDLAGSNAWLTVSGGAGGAFVELSADYVVSYAPIDVSGQKITTLGDATAATDALNRQTGDSRYPLKSDGWSGSFASGSNVLTVASGIITGIA